ncbi:hypothetical protein BU17DRAFT_66031 [Hysterangium stoloniferum]|nr:hypothetical protein BU17DRAFT_66031 [Hysterangium stoloniferum]
MTIVWERRGTDTATLVKLKVEWAERRGRCDRRKGHVEAQPGRVNLYGLEELRYNSSSYRIKESIPFGHTGNNTASCKHPIIKIILSQTLILNKIYNENFGLTSLFVLLNVAQKSKLIDMAWVKEEITLLTIDPPDYHLPWVSPR